MTNKEKKERIQKEDAKAFETFNIERDITYLNPKYTLSKQTANVMTGNGLLKVFELNSSQGGPSFTGRWDGGSRDPGKTERYDLDIAYEAVKKLLGKYGRYAIKELRQPLRSINRISAAAIRERYPDCPDELINSLMSQIGW